MLLPNHEYKHIYPFFYNGSGRTEWMEWSKPSGITCVHVLLVGGGGGGGTGASAAAGTGKGGGGGGSSGGITTGIFPASLLPDTLFIKLGTGGAPATVPVANTNSTYLASGLNSATTGLNSGSGHFYLYAPGGYPGGGGTTAAGGVASINATPASYNSTAGSSGGFPLGAIGITNSIGGVPGSVGGSPTDTGTKNQTVTYFITGGAGGGGTSSAAVAYNGGDIVSTGYWPSISNTATFSANKVHQFTKPLTFYGGTGGRGGGAGTGQAGHPGAPGCGGGGGGGGVTGGAGGLGGNGFAILTCW